jgi:hypothetical protein
MTQPITNELIYEVLKKIQADVAHIKARVDDHDQQFIALRDQMHNMNLSLQTQIHALQGDVLRIDKQMVAIGHRLERIERRLELTDA